jgi:MscS family membrane protein
LILRALVPAAGCADRAPKVRAVPSGLGSGNSLTPPELALESRAMKRVLLLLALTWGVVPGVVLGADPEAAGTMTAGQKTTALAAAVSTGEDYTPHLLEYVVDEILALFDVRSSGNTPTHYAISALMLVVALLARRITTRMLFPTLRRLASKTRTTLDDKLLPAMEGPVAAFIMVVGIFGAFRVLKLSEEADRYIGYGSRVAFSLTLLWGLWSALTALLDHAHEVAKARQLGVAAFMPWLKKTLLTVLVVFGTLLTLQSLGFKVGAVLAGLGIGGLAFALAAQDTLANVFGAVVVAIDQPFKIGEVVRIGQNVGFIEDVGIRSTRIRLIDKSLMVIPNKTVAGDTITNLSRFTRRRIDQVISLTYSTTPEQMEAMVEEIRGIITAQPEVDKTGVMVFFRDFAASSLDIWMVYEVPEPDFQKAFRVRQRVNLAIMRAVEARGLSFAFPTQTVHLAGDIAERLAPRSPVVARTGNGAASVN